MSQMAFQTPMSQDETASRGLSLTTRLLDAFERDAVLYCYWKSAARVGAALAGDKDLDLLVARRDQHRAAGLLLAAGFKLFPTVPARDHPAVLSYLGYDEPSGRLVHVHLHLRLVVGERLLKNYRLPWEDELLVRAVRHAAWPVRVLDPTGNALMLLVRMALELNRTDPLTAQNWRDTLALYDADLADAAAEVPRHELHAIADHLLGPDIGALLTQAFASGAPLGYRVRIRRLLKKRIADYRLHGTAEERLRCLGRALLGLAGRLNREVLQAPRPWNRRAPGGGCVIAVVGLDGSGKSTVVAMLQRWLTPEVDVMPIYFGTGDGRPSLLLAPFKAVVPLAERAFKHKPKGSSHGTVTNHPPRFAYMLCMTVWATVVGLEKRGKLTRAGRAATRGMVVVADRYPQNEIPNFNDGPLLHRLRWVPTILRRFENGAYARAAFMPPDLVLKLVVTPQTAMRREPTMDPGVIAQRVEEFRALAFPGARVVRIDAEQPLNAVIQDVKRAVWSAL